MSTLRPDRIPFVLSSEDYTLALESAGVRRRESRAKHLTEAYGASATDGRGAQRDLTGTIVEIAAARWDGQHDWVPEEGTYKARDLVLVNGLHAQVRGRSRSDWELGPVRRADAAGQVFIFGTLTSERSPRGYLHGWMVTSEAWRPEYWQAHGHRPPAWFIWQEDVRPLASLTPELVATLIGPGEFTV